MKLLFSACLLLCILCCLPADLRAKNCAGLPTSFGGNEFPTGDFFSNFNNNCYLIPLSTGNGSGSQGGDLNSQYNKLYFCAVTGNKNCNLTNLPPYQLIIIGQFPNARYFSISLYDDHSAFIQNLSDVNVVPLTSNDTNPFEPGVAFVSGQHYAIPVNLGGAPGTLEKGCQMNGYNVAVNGMDGTQRHAYMNWNLDTAFLQQGIYPRHQVDTPSHSNPSKAGAVLIRTYLDLTANTTATLPHVIVRDVASGCAYPASYVTGTLSVITTDTNTGNAWQNQQQVQEHNVYANWQSTACWGVAPSSQIQWLRGAEYTPGSNPDSSYLYGYVPAGLPQTLFTAGEVMRLQFRVPATPPTPCINGCSRSGNEQMRYVSVSFQATGGNTLASIPDSCPINPLVPCTPMVQDANGYVTIIAGMGEPQPSWVTAANGYTWLDLSQIPNYTQLNQIALRNILPAGTFGCAGNFVPYKVGEATTNGSGLMGLYAPVIDYPVATSLPTIATELKGPSTCDVFPPGPPAFLTSTNTLCYVVQPAPPVSITALTTQCGTPGCNQVFVQPQPPISIQGNGFGSFPLGLPYTGTSNYLQLAAETWSAGYTGSQCTVTIGEWSETLISLVANVNQNGNCPLASGDPLTVTVWNPQTLQSTSFTTTVLQPNNVHRKH